MHFTQLSIKEIRPQETRGCVERSSNIYLSDMKPQATVDALKYILPAPLISMANRSFVRSGRKWAIAAPPEFTTETIYLNGYQSDCAVNSIASPGSRSLDHTKLSFQDKNCVVNG